MKKICNSCGKEFDENALMHTHTSENGTEYFICDEVTVVSAKTAVFLTMRKILTVCVNSAVTRTALKR